MSGIYCHNTMHNKPTTKLSLDKKYIFYYFLRVSALAGCADLGWVLLITVGLTCLNSADWSPGF